MSSIPENHYRTWAEVSSSTWVMSTDYIRFWAEKILQEMPAKAKMRLCDIGAGNCALASQLVQHSDLEIEMMCVDPLVAPQADLPSCINTVKKDTESFFKENNRLFDGIFFKQSLHHIESSQWPHLFTELFDALQYLGRVVILTMPNTIEYPMFEAARKEFKKKQLSRYRVIELLQKAKFKVRKKPVDYKIKISTENFYNAIKNRFISDLSPFSDEQLSEGIEEIKQQYLENQTEFILLDRLWVITAEKIL